MVPSTSIIKVTSSFYRSIGELMTRLSDGFFFFFFDMESHQGRANPISGNPKPRTTRMHPKSWFFSLNFTTLTTYN